jgi:hypothetical protein
MSSMFAEALQHASPGYALGEKLAALHPQLHMIECESGLFDVNTYARAGHCTVEPRDGMYHQYDTYWSDGELYTLPEIAWLKVAWQDHALDVVLLRWPSTYGHNNRYYVLAPERATCEAFVAAVSAWNHEVRGEILVFHNGCFSKSTELYDAIKAATLEQLVLEGSFKEQIRDDFARFLTSRETYEEHGVPWRRGALFVGPPGNGKTLCVKALVNALAIPCIYVQSFEVPHSTPQYAIEKVFQRARSTAPCLLVLEDIDALLVPGSTSFFLNALDGFADNAGVITLATTNHAERLDPSIVERPSRFDRKYHFDLPSPATRTSYVALWNQRLRPALRVNDAGCAQLANATHGFSFAYIQEVFVSATMRWMSTRDAAGILPIALEQVELLRAQMTRAKS